MATLTEAVSVPSALEPSFELLCNVEVVQLLRERQQDASAVPGAATSSASASAPTEPLGERRWLESEMLELLSPHCEGVSTEGVRRFLEAVKFNPRSPESTYRLTKAEKMQLVDLRPSTEVEVHLIVDECAERLTDGMVQNLLELVQEHLRS